MGLLGTGIGPSLSPALHEREAARHGLDYRYRRVELPPADPEGEFGRALGRARGSGWAGVNVTHPVKQVAVEAVDRLSVEAERTGAVNCIVLRDGEAVGHNTDVAGFREGLGRGVRDDDVGDVLLLGAGGAGAAVACALLSFACRSLTVVDRDAARAAALAERLRTQGLDAVHAAPFATRDEVVARSDGVVNATPTGMAEHPGLPFDAAALDHRPWVADVVYRPLRTPLLSEASRRGCRTVDGAEMAVVQAAESFALFTGLTPDRAAMRADFERLVADERRRST